MADALVSLQKQLCFCSHTWKDVGVATFAGGIRKENEEEATGIQ